MILDIRFYDDGPKQYQHVREINLRTDNSQPELEIIFYDDLYPSMRVNLSRIRDIRTTND